MREYDQNAGGLQPLTAGTAGSETRNIMIVGVGGQGTLLASRLLGQLFLNEGYDVKVSEVHGMSQRGGSVVTYVRFGADVASPLIEKGEADIILSFELLEAARWLPWLKKDGRIITNTQKINPMPVITGAASYPDRLVEKMRDKGASVDAVDCLSLIGKLSQAFDFPEEAWLAALDAVVPAKFREMNRKAFALGRGCSE